MENKTTKGIDLNFEILFQAMPGLLVVLSPDFTILAANSSYLQATHKTLEEILGRNLFQVFPPDKKEEDLLKLSLQHVVTHKEPHTLARSRYEIKSPGSKESQRYWNLVNTPVLDKESNLLYIIHEVRNITTQVQEEEQVKTSHDSLRLMAKIVGGAVWEYDILNRKFTWSESYKHLFGYSDEDLEVEPDDWSFRVHPDDIAQTRVAIEKVISQRGKSWTGEYRYQRADGTYADVLDHAYILYDVSGRPVRMLGSMIDLTKQKEYERELQESNKRIQFLAETIPQIVWSANPDGSVDYFNQRWYEYTRMTETEALGLGWGPSIHPDDLQYSTESWLHSMRTGEKYEIELRLRNIYTDEYRWFLTRALPMRNDAGEIVKWFGTATDIHDFKLLHQQLKESNKQFRFLAKSIPQMVWTTTPDGLFDYVNQRWLDYTGLTLKDSMGHEWKDILHPDDQQRALDRWQHSLMTGEYYEIEYRLKNGSDGTYRWFLAQAMPMRSKKGSILKWFGTCTDIEDHKLAEEELVEKNLELERINQDLDSFVYTASHDLKLPIVNMTGIFEELVRSAEFSDPDAPTMIQMFNKSLRQLHETIHDLSEVVKVQKQKERDLEPIDLLELTEDIMISIQDTLKETGARIHVDFTGAPIIPFNRSSLKSIFYNLINNAIKYRDARRIPEILITSRQNGNFIELKIQDNGIGIDMNKHQNKLFQMFKRFHNHVAGSGLGLYIVNRLLNNHGGYINVESTLNEGTTFYLYFKDITSK